MDIWYRPGPTMRFLLRQRGMGYLPLVLLIEGFALMEFNSPSAVVNMFLALITGPPFQLLGFVFCGVVVFLLGRMFDGEGSVVECVMALAWGALPTAGVRLGVGVVTVLLAGTVDEAILGLCLMPVSFMGWMWGLAWQVATVAAAHRFGWFESTVAVVVPWGAYFTVAAAAVGSLILLLP